MPEVGKRSRQVRHGEFTCPVQESKASRHAMALLLNDSGRRSDTLIQIFGLEHLGCLLPFLPDTYVRQPSEVAYAVASYAAVSHAAVGDRCGAT